MQSKKMPYLEKEISPIVFGTANLILAGAATEMQKKNSRSCGFALLDAAFSAGINCFDCAAIYGEEILGEWMEQRGIREKIVVISKCAHPNERRNRVTESDILYDIHNTSIKLRSDFIDIYMLHRDDPSVPVSKIVDTMNRLYDARKIGVLGVSNWTHQRLQEANNYAVRYGLMPFTVSSPHFSLAEQIGNPWVGQCVTLSGFKNEAARKWYRENNISVFAYSALARGFFSGRFISYETEKAKTILDEAGIKGYYSADNFERLRRAEYLARIKQCTVPQISLAWLFCQSLVVFPVITSSKEQHIWDNITATEIILSDEEVKWLNLEG